MEEVDTVKLFNYYEIIKDFNRLRIIFCIYDKLLTIEQISKETKLSNISIKHQLEYLISKDIIKKEEIKKEVYYKIKNKELIKIIDNDKKFINEFR